MVRDNACVHWLLKAQSCNTAYKLSLALYKGAGRHDFPTITQKSSIKYFQWKCQKKYILDIDSEVMKTLLEDVRGLLQTYILKLRHPITKLMLCLDRLGRKSEDSINHINRIAKSLRAATALQTCFETPAGQSVASSDNAKLSEAYQCQKLRPARQNIKRMNWLIVVSSNSQRTYTILPTKKFTTSSS